MGVRCPVEREGTIPTRRQLVVLLASVPVLLSIGGCARPVDPSEPPSIRFGADVCSRCGMIVSDAAYAAAYRTPGGDVRIFDDAGELPLFLRERDETAVAAFVHDYNARAVIRAEAARFVMGRNLPTPMGTGVVALASEAEAAALAERVGGKVLTYRELLDSRASGLSVDTHGY